MIQIDKQVVDTIFTHADAELPNEACGYLGGKGGRVTGFFPMTNADNAPDHFSFLPEEQFKVIRQVREMGLEIIGNYHSHPVTPARPSAEDIALAYDREIIYFIASLAGERELKAYKIEDDRVVPVPLEINDE